MISEIVPHAVYDSESDLYELHLKVKMEDNFSVRLGGSVSTTSSNQIYLGIGYQNLNYYSKEITFDGQLGKIYNNAQLMGKIDLPTNIPTSFRLLLQSVPSITTRRTSCFPGMTNLHSIQRTNVL